MSYRILFLEDEEDLVEDLPRLYKQRGIEIVGTISIPDALRLLKEEHFDAVLLDIIMPPTEDMDAERVDYGRRTGVEVVRRMKKIKPHIPIVALTVITDPEIRTEIYKAGVKTIINKPADPERIYEELQRVLKQSR